MPNSRSAITKMVEKYYDNLKAYYEARETLERLQHDYDLERARLILKGVPGSNEMERKAYLDVKTAKLHKRIVEARGKMLRRKAMALAYAASLGMTKEPV